MRRYVQAVAVLAAIATLAACGTQSSQGTEAAAGELVIGDEVIADAELWAEAQSEGGFTLYSGMNEERELALIDEFMAQVPLTVEVVSVNAGNLTERVLSEKGSGVLEADVIRQADGTLIAELEKNDVFVEHCPTGWEEIADELKSPDCLWWASLQSIWGIAYNTEVLPDDIEVSSWADLTNPELKGLMGLTWIGHGGSSYARGVYEVNEFGSQYWEHVAAVEPSIQTSIGNLVTEIERGEVAIGPAAVSIAGNAKGQGAPIEVVLPDEGVPAYSQFVGLVDGAENSAAGKVFLNWMSSVAGQNAVAKITGDYPVREDAEGPTVAGEQLPPRSELNVFSPEGWDDYYENREQYLDEWARIFNYTP